MPYVRILLILNTIILLSVGSLHAQPRMQQRRADIDAGLTYNESVFLISNYSAVNDNASNREELTVAQLLEQPVEGFYFYLRHDDKTDNIMVRKPDGEFTALRPILEDIRQALERDSLKLMTLFLDFNVELQLDSIFKQTGLAPMVSVHKDTQSWPTLREAVSSGKRLTVFEVTKHVSHPAWMNVMDDFVEHTDRAWGNYSRMPEQFDRRLKHSLSLFDGYRILTTQNLSSDDITEMARHTPYLIESFRTRWVRDGQLPNFILVDRYYQWMGTLLLTVKNYNMVYGIVSANNEPVNYVNWDEMSNATAGTFCFPVEQGGELMLAPTVPGYEVEPQKTYAKGDSKKTYVTEFKATPVAIGKDIELYLSFDNDRTEDKSLRHRKLTADGITQNFETTRGQYATFDKGSRISLPTAAELNIRDHDFTVSAWVKIPEYLPGKDDYTVIGARNNAYQHGLHLIIRDQKPFMGFFNNDLQGNSNIEPNRWYNITWRYNKSNGEQAIFVDGKLDAISTGRPPYMGSDSLYVGFNQTEQTYMIGMLDNLCIWSRVLSDKEILGISNQIIDISISPQNGNRTARILLTLLAVAVVFTILWSLLVRRMQVMQSRKSQSTGLAQQKQGFTPPKAQVSDSQTTGLGDEKQCIAEGEPANSITVFGDFRVTDKDGEDITQLFTPKLRQLFFLLLLNSTKGQSGISGSDISDSIWGDKDGKNVRSLRSVSILKLRKILDRMDKMEITYAGSKYRLQRSGDVKCDYADCLDMLDNKRVNSREDFERFYSIVSKGEVFKGESFDWMDDFKSRVCSLLVDTMSRFIRLYSVDSDADKVIEIANQILLNDPCNEEALYYKVKALIKQNNAKSAQYTYQKFCSMYEQMYGEPYKTSFDELIAKDESQIEQGI